MVRQIEMSREEKVAAMKQVVQQACDYIIRGMENIDRLDVEDTAKKVKITALFK